MATIYSVGTRYDRLISVSGFTKSSDGYTWTPEAQITEPFLPHQSAVGVATDGITITAVSDDGYVASSTDGGLNWVNGTIIDGNLGPRAIDFSYDNQGDDGLFMLVGNQKYARSEVLIGSSADNWKMVYTVYNRNDIFTEIQQFDAPMIVEDVPLTAQTAVNFVDVSKSTYPLLDDFITNGLGVVEFSMNVLDRRSFDGVADLGAEWRIYFSGDPVTYGATDDATFTWTTSAAWVTCAPDICLQVGGYTYTKAQITNYGVMAQRYDEVAQIFKSPNGDQDSWTMIYSRDDNDSIFHSVHRFATTLLATAYPALDGTNASNVTIEKDTAPLVSDMIDRGNGLISFSNAPGENEYTGAIDNGDSWTISYSGNVTYTTTDLVSFTWQTPGAWVAVGESIGNNPMMVYSVDNGNTWNDVEIPALFDGRPMYDICYANERFYIASYGVIITTTGLSGDGEWNATDFVSSGIASPDFVRIAANPSGHVVAVSSGLIYYTLDGTEWKRQEIPGYQFTSVAWFNDHWVVGCYTLLTHWTCFTSTDTVNWTPDNNQIHMYDFHVM